MKNIDSYRDPYHCHLDLDVNLGCLHYEYAVLCNIFITETHIPFSVHFRIMRKMASVIPSAHKIIITPKVIMFLVDLLLCQFTYIHT